MVNTAALEEAITASGRTKVFIAGELGITVQGLRDKLQARTEFKASEIKRLKALLDLSITQCEKIFFA